MMSFISLISIFGWGRAIFGRLMLGRSVLEKLSLSYLTGLLILTLGLFFANILGLAITPVLTNALSIIGALIFFIYLYLDRVLGKLRITTSTHSRPYFLALLTLATIVLLYGLWGVVATWDALTLYDFRALRLIEFGYLDQVARLQGSYFYSYPLFTSLAHAYLYLASWSSPLILYALLYLSLLISFYYLLRNFASSNTSLLGTLLVAIAPHYFWHSQIAYTNLPYSIYLSLGTLYLYIYQKNGRVVDLLLGVILSAGSTWIRSAEPFWLINLAYALYLVISRKGYRHLPTVILINLAIERIWKIYSASMQSKVAESTLSQISSTTTTLVSTISPDKMTLITSATLYFFNHAMRPYLPVLLLFAVSIFIKIISKSRDYALDTVTLGYYAISFAGTLVFASSQSYWSNIPGSLERMMIFISIPIIYNFSLNLKKIL